MDVSRIEPTGSKFIKASDIDPNSQVEKGIWKAPDGKSYRIAYYPKGMAHSERRVLTDNEVKEFLTILGESQIQLSKLGGLTVSIKGIDIPDPEEAKHYDLDTDVKGHFVDFTVRMSELMSSIRSQRSLTSENPLDKEIVPQTTSQLPKDLFVEEDDSRIELVEVPEDDLLERNWEVITKPKETEGLKDQIVVEEADDFDEVSDVESFFDEDSYEEEGFANIIVDGFMARYPDLDSIPDAKGKLAKLIDESLHIQRENEMKFSEELKTIEHLENPNSDSWAPYENDDLSSALKSFHKEISGTPSLNGLSEEIKYIVVEPNNPVLARTCEAVSREWLVEQDLYDQLDSIWIPKGVLKSYIKFLEDPSIESRASLFLQLQAVGGDKILEPIIRKVEEKIIIRSFSEYVEKMEFNTFPKTIKLSDSFIQKFREYLKHPFDEKLNSEISTLIDQLPEREKRFLNSRKLILSNMLAEYAEKVRGL